MSGVRPLVSVLMAVYNAPGDYLDAAIQSILGQSLADFEFIIVDDGSDAATRDRLGVYAARDARIRLHCLPVNVGLTQALNAGLELVQGAYVARQDADDISRPNRLEVSFRFLEQHPDIDAAGTNAALIDAEGNRLGTMDIDMELKKLQSRNLLVHGSMIFRRRVFERLGGYDERMRLSQDYELYLRMRKLHGMRLGVVPEVLYSLRQHSDSLSSRRMFQQLYFSVLAKTLTLPAHLPYWRKQLYFAFQLARDLVFTHRLLLGSILRRLLRVSRSGKVR